MSGLVHAVVKMPACVFQLCRQPAVKGGFFFIRGLLGPDWEVSPDFWAGRHVQLLRPDFLGFFENSAR